MNAFFSGLLGRPRTLVTLLIFLLGAGAYVYVSIPKEANPDIDVPLFYVSVAQEGISPEDSQRLLVKPLEQELRSLEGLKEIRATASEGHAGIVLEFDVDFDKDEALSDVRDKVDRAQAELPDEADEPTITETNFSLVPTIIVALSGDVPERTLYRHAKMLQDALEAIPTVLSAELSGAREERFEVLIDRTLLESYDVDPVELLNRITRNNALVAAGFLDTGDGRFSIKVPGLIETGEDIYDLVIKQNAEGVVTVGDIAEVRRTFEDPTLYTRVNGRPAITVNVVKRIGENIIENNEAVRAVTAATAEGWPEPIKIDFMLDESSFIYEVLGGLEASIATAIVLVMIVVVAALGFRSALLIGIAIPSSILLGFLVLSGVGMTVNMMVMFGLVLTVGLLVDGAIVIVEYADRKIAEGMDRAEAFVAAAQLMVWPLVASTATTLIAFMPMLLWPGVPGEFMSYLPIMVVIVLSVALLTALVFLPAVGGVLSDALIVGLIAGAAAAGIAATTLEAIGPAGYAVAAASFLGATILTTLLAKRWGIGRRKPVAAPEGPFDPARIRGLTGVYVRTLRALAGNVFGIIATLVAVGAIAAAVMTTFMANATGVEFFVDEEPDVAVVMVSARGNMSARQARDLVMDVEREVLAIDGVENMVSVSFPSGSQTGGGGQPGGVQDAPADIIGQLQIDLVPYCCRRPASEIFADIRERTQFAGIKTEVREVQGGPPTGKDIQLQLTADTYDKVLAATSRVRAHVETVAGLRDVEDDRPLPGIEYQLMVDREEAGRFGADVRTVGQIIQLVTNGVYIDDVNPDDADDPIDVRVRYPASERTLDQFADLRLPTAEGQVPIINFIDIAPQPRVSAIKRLDGAYVMTVKADVIEAEGYDLNGKIAELDAWMSEQTWPEGVNYAFRGANEEQAESMAFLMKAMLASLFLMFLILVTQYNNFYQTALTLITIVLSVFGVLLGMVITGQKFSVIMTGTGIIALAGIVVNNAIVLIDTFNRARREQPDVLSAVLAAAAQRIRPILLTTITTIAGLIPMATQVNLDFFERTIAVGGITSVWWVQLSTAIISGLAFSTILTLFVVPVMLAMPETVSRTVRRRPAATTTAAVARTDRAAVLDAGGPDRLRPLARPMPATVPERIAASVPLPAAMPNRTPGTVTVPASLPEGTAAVDPRADGIYAAVVAPPRTRASALSASVKTEPLGYSAKAVPAQPAPEPAKRGQGDVYAAVLLRPQSGKAVDDGDKPADDAGQEPPTRDLPQAAE